MGVVKELQESPPEPRAHLGHKDHELAQRGVRDPRKPVALVPGHQDDLQGAADFRGGRSLLHGPLQCKDSEHSAINDGYRVPVPLDKIQKTYIAPLQLLAAEEVWKAHVVRGRGFLKCAQTEVLRNVASQLGINIPRVVFVGRNKHRALDCKRRLFPDEVPILCGCLQAMEIHPRQIHNRRFCTELKPLYYGFTNPRYLEWAESKLLKLEQMDFSLTDFCAGGCFAFINWAREVCVLAVLGEDLSGRRDVLSDLEGWSLRDWNERLLGPHCMGYVKATVLVSANAPRQLLLCFKNPENKNDRVSEVQQGPQQNAGNTNPFESDVSQNQAAERPNYLPSVVRDDSALERLKEEIEENHKNVKICIQNNLYMRHMVDDLSESQHEILNKVQQLLAERTKIAEQCEVLCKKCCDKENESLKEAIGQLRNEVDDLKKANQEILQDASKQDVHTKTLHAARLDDSVARFLQLLKHANAERGMPPGRIVLLRSF